MATTIEMPKLSDTMTSGVLVRWLKQTGDSLQPGDMIAEIETDKATMELENFEKGVLLNQFVQPGATISVGTPICTIGSKAELDLPIISLSEIASEANNLPSQDKPPFAAEAEPAPTPSISVPVIQILQSAPTSIPTNSRIKISPLAKRIAHDHQVCYQHILGTGPGGRIIRIDILKAQAQNSTDVKDAQLTVTQIHSQATPHSENTVHTLALKDQILPISSMRSTIAKRLVESKTQIPHFYVEIEANTTQLSILREGTNQHLREQYGDSSKVKLTINDFILKAASKALEKIPSVNASWTSEGIKQHGTVDLAFGVALDDGLVTPVIRASHTKSIQTISQEAKALIAKARSKKLKIDEMTGSTFTVTNLGMFGISRFYGIINPPNAGILSVGSGIRKPIVDTTGTIVVGECTVIGFSGDHRVIDGATAALFLKTIKELLEKPYTLLL